jgi:CRISPR-associated exonuclease Cas4
MYADEDLIPIAALQHHLFCARQCALIHVDGLWAENRLTVEGKVLHERSDAPGHRTRVVGADRVRRVRAMPLISRRLGLVGRADVVEFRAGCAPRPIEHKRGRPKRLEHDRVQVAAQALCLEEMLGLRIDVAELFYHATRHRQAVDIDSALRAQVEAVAVAVREGIERNVIPVFEKQAKCRRCSLLHLCLPSGTGPCRDPAAYLARSVAISASAAT